MGNPYSDPARRPRCAACGRPLDPAEASHDGAHGLCGFYPCPVHPGAGVTYPAERPEFPTYHDAQGREHGEF